MIIEKHYRGLVSRSVCDAFWEQVTRQNVESDAKALLSSSPPSTSGVSDGTRLSDAIESSSSSRSGPGVNVGGSSGGTRVQADNSLPPVIATPKYCLIHIKRQDLYFLAVLQQETSPLLILEWLNRVAETLHEYLGVLSEESVKDNFVTVYQLLDEMMDGGHVMTVESNILQELIPPPSLFSKMRDQVLGPRSSLGATLPDGSTSTIYWRRNAKYTTNEIFLDIIEEIDAILDKTGTIVTLDTLGKVVVASHLSGMPDLTLRFANPSLLDDVSFHPCVRLARYAHDKAISFIPPDGQFTLMTFRVPGASSGGAHLTHNLNVPLHIQPSISFTETGGKVHITVAPRIFGSQDKVIENVVLTIPFPKSVAASATLSANVGTVHYDEMSKVCKWSIGRLSRDKVPVLDGTVHLQPGAQPPEANPTILVDFLIMMYSASGLKVESLVVHNVSYNPYKGVRSITKAGKFQVRC